ncbi:uncharacterized protein LOC110996729 [Pieris rapae]|uniref:uncharacterized protein LOC110996729 n=1 Tax=Pieris rapae TaxID=64459 RepID=UPI001E27BEA7|nr:uncharacterized protein LOC110996729 [Pieris rapae]
MASGDTPIHKQNMTFARSNIPIIGAFVDYVNTSIEYIRTKSFSRAERLQASASPHALSATFIAFVCLSLGMVSNVKFEVVTYDEEPLPNDLHFVLMSKVDKLYVDDIDVSRVLCCIEASDTVVILFSTLLIWNTGNVRSPLSEYFFLPWLGATMRGLCLRQAPTAVALLYTMSVANGNINPLFLTAFSFLFLLEARLWLEIARLVCLRWQRRDHVDLTRPPQNEVETLWSNDDVQSLEVGNFVY